ncbi:MAG TPA: L-ribulose-5-phosphate 4-epimerase [Armatimonadota bacterium]|nr:L-ribulose-5-phosphate 4-epimerase [Armatimonadota bacterium]
MLEELKSLVCKYNKLLPERGLVTSTSGNVSARDFASNLVIIKPSGLDFDELTPQEVSVVDLDGNIVEGRYNPSVDTATHLYVYRHMPDVGSVIHTHSNYATAFAALGRPIPCYLTAIADEFGCAIPVSDYAKIGGEEIGQEIVAKIGDCPAILMRNHGVFTIGRTVQDAFKAAAMVEDVAKTCYLALLLGRPEELPPEEVKRAHRQYMEKYGQET